MFSQPANIKLWKELDVKKENHTTLYISKAPDSINTKIAAIILPGGSYAHLMGIKTEGFEVAKWLNNQGINAFILEYRVKKNGYHYPSEIEDLQAAIYFLRKNAEKYNINPDALGVIGFSAGGHLSLMSGVFQNINYLEKYNIKPSNLKPNFIVPVYPVVSMQDSIVHKKSRKNLLGLHPDQETKNKFSMELQISDNMPPTLLVATKDDPKVNFHNSLVLNDAFLNKKIPNFKFLLYDNGGHGFGLNDKLGKDAAQWKYVFINWLKEINISK
jgi:acetyl esterase/lipase